MALAMVSPVSGPSSALMIAKCSISQPEKARSVALAFCPLASPIKHWEAKHVSTKGRAAAMGPMPQPGINVLSSRHPVRRLLLNASSCCFYPPSSRMLRVEAGPASVESEGQSSQGTLGVTLESSEGVKKPIVDASNLNAEPAKRCSACGHSKLLGDFEDTVTTEDKRMEVCRACLAAIRARRVKGRELYHLELTPEKAWERAKICSKCVVRKEIRDFFRARASKDGTTTQCRSCISNYGKAKPVVLPVDTPQRCYTCNEMKPASNYFVHPRMPTGLNKSCKLCELKRQKERYSRSKQFNAIVPRHDKVRTSCGQLKVASEFPKHPTSIDALGHLCKSCDRAHSFNRYHKRKARETRAGPPSSE
jgi:hypothetical protein